VAAAVGREREQRKKKEERRRAWAGEKGTNKDGALLRYKGASEAGTLPVNVVRSSDSDGCIGHHHPWHPSMHWSARMADALCLGLDME
jgi:hypothetical protein